MASDQANFKEVSFHYRKGKRVFYSYDEELYCATFPQEWAKNHLAGTGPKDCKVCACVGSWNGVFIGYCVGCCENYYFGKRGRGLITYGKEIKTKDTTVPSIFETYLKDVDPYEVGDTDYMDSALAVNQLDFEECEIEDLLIPESEWKDHLIYGITDDEIKEINAYYDEIVKKEENHDYEEIGYTVDRTGYYGSSGQSGYSSY
jgi:hypothetical protein|uniref:Uncharacterized protein n=1 Tax=viral metagenome TaxID=1070528 RepID=A0A6C0D716_9ZZZZ